MDFKPLLSGEYLLKFATSIILIPKTFYKVIIQPRWVPDYVPREENEDIPTSNSFTDPITFWVIVGVLPIYFFIDFYVYGFAEPYVVTAYSKMDATFGLTIFILFLAAPLSTAFVLQWFKFKNFEKNSFKRYFLIECYYSAPMQLLSPLSIFVSEEESYVDYLSILSAIGMIWFIVCQIVIIRQELNAKFFGVLKVLVVMYLSSFIFLAICMLLFVLLNGKNLRLFVDSFFGSIGNISN